eukprot:6197312-Pleurochrysis_carterae.AAC.3
MLRSASSAPLSMSLRVPLCTSLCTSPSMSPSPSPSLWRSARRRILSCCVLIYTGLRQNRAKPLARAVRLCVSCSIGDWRTLPALRAFAAEPALARVPHPERSESQYTKRQPAQTGRQASAVAAACTELQWACAWAGPRACRSKSNARQTRSANESENCNATQNNKYDANREEAKVQANGVLRVGAC